MEECTLDGNEIDYLTTEGALSYRIITNYAEKRASGYTKEHTISLIVEDISTVPWDNLEDKKTRDKMAKPEEIQRIISIANRHPCSNELLEKLKDAHYFQSNRTGRTNFARENFGSIHFPLFNEEIYDTIESARRKNRAR